MGEGKRVRKRLLMPTALGLLSASCGPDFTSCEAHLNCPLGGSTGQTWAGGASGSDPGIPGGGGHAGGLGAGAGGVAGEAGSSAGGAVLSGGASGGAASPTDAGRAGAGGSVPGCALSASPRIAPCVLDHMSVVYVSSKDGNDENAGTRGAPVQTFGRALSLATPAKMSIVACAGAYAENVQITGGVAVYGGFDCEGEEKWTKLSTLPTVVKPLSGVALNVSGVAEAVSIEGVEFHAEDASGAGASSIAAVVKSSTRVSFKSGRFVAGKGVDGESAPETIGFTERASSGYAAQGRTGGAARECVCGSETTRGGQGGNAASDGGAPGPGGDGAPDRGQPNAGQGGESTLACNALGGGGNGAPGPDGAALGEGAKRRGSWTEAGYQPEPGKAGMSGGVGQGGGGGRGGENGGGGGGGCGGCGGQGGMPGKGGGASIGLVVLDSLVILSETQVAVSQAGNGGRGASGGEGQEGGLPGDAPDLTACNGGVGGKGGKGRAGGGGAGGIAVGILFQGTEPLTDTVIAWFTKGLAGQGGAGGDPDASVTADDGVSGGESVPILRISALGE